MLAETALEEPGLEVEIMMSDWEVIVIGAGPAGMMAAIRSAELGKRTLLIERNRKLGVKILISGGSRCNVTHQTDCQGIVDAFGRNGRFLHSALSRFSPTDTVRMLADEGVGIKTEPNGKIFPATDKALDVQQALIRRLERSGCQVANLTRVIGLETTPVGFRVISEQGEYLGGKLIVTTGGKSYPGCGTTGDGYQWMAAWGHTIVPPHPALVPLKSPVPWLPDLSGIALQDAQAFVVPADGLPTETDLAARYNFVRKRCLMQRRAPLLFTHVGVSGPAPMDVSKAFSQAEDLSRVAMVIDLLPEFDVAALESRWDQAVQSHAKKQILRLGQILLAGTEVPLRLWETLLQLSEVSTERPVSEIKKTENSKLLSGLKTLVVPISGTLGFAKAEVTTGGVKLSEVDSKTMASKLVPNLYIAGELLDLDGWIGGYNFQSAFATGWVAGETN